MLEFLQQYGLWAILLGTALEGETILVLGGYLAHRGYFPLWSVMAVAFIGSVTGDQAAFFLGRRFGQPWVQKRPKWQARVARVNRLRERRGLWLLVGFRFLYGIRTAAPIAFALSGIPAKTFTPLNMLGAAIWAVVVGGLGYVFGQSLAAMLEDAHRYEIWVLVVVAALAIAVSVFRALRAKRAASAQRETATDD